MTDKPSHPPMIEEVLLQDVIDTCASEDQFNIIVLGNRPGINLFCVKLEYENFIPGTPYNEEFKFFKISWGELVWFVISIPADKREIAEQVAEETRMRLSDGVPNMITGGSEEFAVFPIQGENTFTLTNASDSPAYGSHEEREVEIKRVRVASQEIMDRHIANLKADSSEESA